MTDKIESEAMVELRQRCKDLHQKLGRDAMLYQNKPVDTILNWLTSILEQSAPALPADRVDARLQTTTGEYREILRKEALKIRAALEMAFELPLTYEQDKLIKDAFAALTAQTASPTAEEIARCAWGIEWDFLPQHRQTEILADLTALRGGGA